MNFWAYFSKKFNKLSISFLSGWTKNAICRKFFRKFSKRLQQNFLRKLRKCIILAYFSENLTNHALIFRAFGRKTQIDRKFWENFEIFDQNSIEKLDFFIIFGKFVTKNRDFGNNTIFQQQFLRFRGGGISPFPPGYALDPHWVLNYQSTIKALRTSRKWLPIVICLIFPEFYFSKFSML